MLRRPAGALHRAAGLLEDGQEIIGDEGIVVGAALAGAEVPGAALDFGYPTMNLDLALKGAHAA